MNYLDILQSFNDVLYKLFGLIDTVLEFQIYINTKRSENDEHDPKQEIYFDGKFFVQ